MKEFKIALVLALIAAIVFVVLQNTAVISLQIFFWTVSMSRILFFLILLIAGFVLGYITARFFKPR